jgi:aconitate hydratase
MTSLNSFGSKSSLDVNGRVLDYYSLRSPALAEFGVDRLPYSIKVLLENLLRHEDGVKVNASDIEALARWAETPTRHGETAGEDAHEIAFTPERVLMQDLTGVPAVVDLASMRDAIIALGGDPNKINPLVPVELVIDHSVILERTGTPESFEENVAIEYQRNVERYTFLKWAQSSFKQFRVVPPGMGICHQVNLEHLARVVFEHDGVAYLDTVVGTDSHTTMVNGVGVLGWGVGGIEAEAGMLGQPTSMLIPPRRGSTAFGCHA